MENHNLNIEGCVECRMQFLVYPGEISPQKITEVLGIEPTETGIKGQIAGPNSSGKVRIVPMTIWFLISDEVIQSNRIEQHLDWMLDKLLAAKPGIDQIKQLPGMKFYFRCTWWTKTGGWFTFTADQLRKLSLLDIDLQFEIAAYPDEKEEPSEWD